MKILGWMVLISLSLGTAMLLRYGLIQPSLIGLQCVDAARPFWCWPREVIILIHIWNGWSLSSLLLLMLYVRYGGGHWLALGFVASCLGMVLYNTGLASLAFLLGLYLLGRRNHETAR